MEKWKYKSLEWLHKAREDNFDRTRELAPAELIEKSRLATDEAIKSMGLKVVSTQEKAAAH